MSFCSARRSKLCGSASTPAKKTPSKLQKWCVYASREALYDPSVILSLLQSFGSAKLDLGAELQAVATRLQAQIGGTGGGDPNLADLVAAVVELAAEADADASALFSLLRRTRSG